MERMFWNEKIECMPMSDLSRGRGVRSALMVNRIGRKGVVVFEG